MNLKEVYYDDSKLTNEKEIETYRDLILRENNRQSFIDRANQLIQKIKPVISKS